MAKAKASTKPVKDAKPVRSSSGQKAMPKKVASPAATGKRNTRQGGL